VAAGDRGSSEARYQQDREVVDGVDAEGAVVGDRAHDGAARAVQLHGSTELFA